MKSETIKKALKLLGVEEGQPAVSQQREPIPPAADQRSRLIASYSITEGYQDFSNSNVRVDPPILNPKDTVFYSDCPSCKARHVTGQPCPEKSSDWMNIEGNRVVKAISNQLDQWALSPLKQTILEAIERFDQAWEARDELAFKAAVSEIDDLLLKASEILGKRRIGI
ncbi:MAG: hypothetical protein ACYDBV_04940 [Nitrospiria bacterium]